MAKTLLLGMIETALGAGEILRRHFKKKIRVQEKPGAGLVTNADLEAEAYVIKKLKKLGPEFSFLTEEAHPEEANVQTQDPRWIVDPLDGTTNFVHRFPMFCVSLAAEWDGKVQLGVIYHPILKDLYTCERGKGAYLFEGGHKTSHRLKVSNTKRIEDSLLSTGFSYSKLDVLKAEMKIFEILSQKARAIRRPGSAALDLAYTARGIFDGFWEHKLSPWDVAAGGLLVQEAKGYVTDFLGTPFNPNARQILAANPTLHALLHQVILTKNTNLY